MKDKSRLCAHRTARGKRCLARHVKGSRYCGADEPSLARKRAEARKRGGRQRRHANAPAAKVKTIEDVRVGLCQVVGNLMAQDNTVPVARALIAAYSELRATLETGELEARLAALEERLEEERPR